MSSHIKQLNSLAHVSEKLGHWRFHIFNRNIITQSNKTLEDFREVYSESTTVSMPFIVLLVVFILKPSFPKTSLARWLPLHQVRWIGRHFLQISRGGW